MSDWDKARCASKEAETLAKDLGRFQVAHGNDHLFVDEQQHVAEIMKPFSLIPLSSLTPSFPLPLPSPSLLSLAVTRAPLITFTRAPHSH